MILYLLFFLRLNCVLSVCFKKYEVENVLDFRCGNGNSWIERYFYTPRGGQTRSKYTGQCPVQAGAVTLTDVCDQIRSSESLTGSQTGQSMTGSQLSL